MKIACEFHFIYLKFKIIKAGTVNDIISVNPAPYFAISKNLYLPGPYTIKFVWYPIGVKKDWLTPNKTSIINALGEMSKTLENSIATGNIKATEAALLTNWVRITVDTKITTSAKNRGIPLRTKLRFRAIKSANPVTCIATLNEDNDPSNKMISNLIDFCISAALKHPDATIAITAKRTAPTSGILVNVGKTTIPIAIAIEIGFFIKKGKSSSNWSNISKSLLA